MKRSFILLFLLTCSVLMLNAQSRIVPTNVNSNPSGATVIVNGPNYNNFTTQTPKQLNFRQGLTYTLTFSLGGYQSQTITHVGGERTIYVNLASPTTSTTMNTVSQNGTLSVTSNANGAAVLINGQQYGAVPLTVQLAPGYYNIEVTMTGYKPFSGTVNIKPGSSQTIYAQMESAGGKLSVNSSISGAQVFINNQMAGNTPYEAVYPAGTYTVTVRMSGYKDFISSVTLGNGASQQVFANLEMNTSKLTVNSNISGADVLIGSQKVGVTPLTLDLAPGSYDLQVKYPNHKDYTSRITLTGDQTVYANLELYNFVTFRIPKNAQLFINNSRINFAGGDKGKWAEYSHYGTQSKVKVKVQYFDLEIEKEVELNRSTITITLDLR